MLSNSLLTPIGVGLTLYKVGIKPKLLQSLMKEDIDTLRAISSPLMKTFAGWILDLICSIIG